MILDPEDSPLALFLLGAGSQKCQPGYHARQVRERHVCEDLELALRFAADPKRSAEVGQP
jgi:hypothetical protein